MQGERFYTQMYMNCNEIHPAGFPGFGKPAGPPGNLRPIILLSTIRKILSICMITRIQDKLNSVIQNSQAAYRPGRSTTEHVFAFKSLAEKVVTSSNYEIIIEMLDMSFRHRRKR